MAGDVTLDLNEFTLYGVPGSWNGIDVAVSNNNITVKNGIIRDWDNQGVYAETDNCKLSELRAIGNESSRNDGSTRSSSWRTGQRVEPIVPVGKIVGHLRRADLSRNGTKGGSKRNARDAKNIHGRFDSG